jgi:hypothetical protein
MSLEFYGEADPQPARKGYFSPFCVLAIAAGFMVATGEFY